MITLEFVLFAHLSMFLAGLVYYLLANDDQVNIGHAVIWGLIFAFWYITFPIEMFLRLAIKEDDHAG